MRLNLALVALSQIANAQQATDLPKRVIPGFTLKLRSEMDQLQNSVLYSPRAHQKNALRGTCADRPQGNQCCPGQDWNCQPPNAVCSCDAHCKKMGDCCPDYDDTCGHMLTTGPRKCTGSATGRINGDPHYHTFDQKMIHFQGKCSYVLAKNCGDGPVDFRIVANNENRYGNMDMSWTRNVYLTYDQTKIEVKKNRIIELNGERVYTPYMLDDGTTIEQSGMYIAVRTGFGVDIYYDGDGNAEVKVTCDWFGKLCGLLGNYNGDPDDDFNGSDNVAYGDKSVEAFGESWREWADPNQPPHCDLNQLTILPASPKWFDWVEGLKARPNAAMPSCSQSQFTRAVKKCEILSAQNDVFAPCHAKVDPANFFENCVWDQCATNLDPAVLCNSLSTMAMVCSDKMVPVQWRSAELCPAACPVNSHYDYCGPVCVDSCATSFNDKNEACKTAQCVEGCFCNEGFVWDGLTCVRRDQCGCTNGDLSYRVGESYFKRNCSKKCTCVGIGKEECESDPCRNDEACVASDFSRSGVLLFEPIYQCERVKGVGGKKRPGNRPGTSFQLGQRPKDKKPNTGNKGKNDKDDKEDEDDLGIWGIDARGRNRTMLNAPMPNFGPEVIYPACLPTEKWTRGIVKPDWIPPNQCCGNRPYNDMQFACCNNLALYDEREEKCCTRLGVVIKKSEKCSRLERKLSSMSQL